MQVISWILLKKVEKQFSYWMTEIEYCICSSMIKPQTPCFSGDCPGNGVFFYELPHLFQKREKLFRAFVGWAEVAFEAVEAVGVAAFDDADAFGAA